MNDRTCPIMGHRLVSSGQIDYAFPRRDGLKRRHGAHRRCRPAEKARRARDVPIEPRGNSMENAAPDSMFVQWQRFMAGQEVDRRIVKPMVYDSWVRSRAYGVRHDRRPEGRVDDARLAELLADQILVIACADRPVTVTDAARTQALGCLHRLQIAAAAGGRYICHAGYVSDRTDHAADAPCGQVPAAASA